MPPQDPTNFGRFGAFRHMEKQIADVKKLHDAYDRVGEQVQELYTKDLPRGSKEAKKANAEVANAMAAVKEQLKGLNLEAKDYEKQLAQDTKAILAFKDKHKLTLEEATAMYKKTTEAQQRWQGGLKRGLDYLKRWGSVAATVGAATSEYRKRLDEIHTGYQQVAASSQMTGDAARVGFAKTQKYIDGYRKALRSAHEMTAKYNVSADEARQMTKALGLSLRGNIKDVSRFGDQLKNDTDLMFSFSKVMNVQASDALAFFREEMRRQGKTHAEAVKSMDTMISAFDRMAETVPAGVRPFKEDYFEVLKGIRAEMGPVHISTSAMTAQMNMLAEAAGKAGLSAEGVKDAMGALPKLSKSLPKFFKIQLGQNIMNMSEEALKKFPEGLRKQIKTIRNDPSLLPFQKAELMQELTAGTKEGMQATLNMLMKAGPRMRGILMKQSGMSAQQQVAFMKMFQDIKGGKIDLETAAGKIDKMGKEAKKSRETMPQKLDKNTKGLDSAARWLQKQEQATRALIDQYSHYVTPAMGALTLALNASNWSRAMDNMSQVGGKLGKLGKVAGTAGSVLAAFGVGYSIGTALDKWLGLSTKISDTLFEVNKEMLSGLERKRRSAGHSQQALRLAESQIKNFEQLAAKGITLKKRGPGGKIQERKVTKEFVRANIMKQMDFEGQLKRGEINKAQMDIMVKAIDKRLENFDKKVQEGAAKRVMRGKSPEMQRIIAKQAGLSTGQTMAAMKQEKLQRRAEAKEKAGRRALFKATPQARATVTPPTTAEKTAGGAGAPAAAAAGGAAAGAQAGAAAAPGETKFDPAKGVLEAKVVLPLNDPSFQQFTDAMVAQSKARTGRGR